MFLGTLAIMKLLRSYQDTKKPSSDLKKVFLPTNDQGMKRVQAAAPIAGTWIVGDTVENSAPATATNIGWVCTTAGTPGTWKSYGVIS